MYRIGVAASFLHRVLKSCDAYSFGNNDHTTVVLF